MGLCSRCGQPLIEGMAFCGRCGAAVAPMSPPSPAYAQPAYAQPGQPVDAQPGAPTHAPHPQHPSPDAVGQAPQYAFTVPITTEDVTLWLRAAGALLGVTLISGFILAFLVGLFLPGANHGNPADWFAVGLLAAGMALGARVGVSRGSFDAGDGSFGASFDLRVSVLLITVVFLVAVRLLARRAERAKPGASLRDLTLRALGTSLTFTVAMAILAAAVHIHKVYGFNLFGAVAVDGSPTSPAGLSVGGSVGALVLGAGSLFLWPLLLTAAVWWGSAFAVWLRVGATSDPNPAAMKLAWLWTCRPAFLAVRAQILATLVLAGVGTYVYAVAETLNNASQSDSAGSSTARIVLGLLLALPNLAAYAGSVSLGVPISGFGPIANILGVVGNIDPTNIDPNSTGGTPYTSTLSVAGSTSFGFFGATHPAVVYLLVIASVVGTLGAAKWAVGKSWDRGRALLGPGQAWRGAVLGALLWVAVGFAAQLVENTSVMDMGTDLSIGPSLPGLLLAGAVWGLVTCLAMSFFAGHLTATPIAQPAPAAGQPGPGTPADPAHAGPEPGEDVVDMGTVIELSSTDPDERA